MTESSENDQKRTINNIKGTIFKVLSKKVSSVHISKKQLTVTVINPIIQPCRSNERIKCNLMHGGMQNSVIF